MSDPQQELKYIKDKLGTISLEKIANHLGKSVESIEMILIRKNGSANTKMYTGMLTAGELAKILKVDRNTVMGWIQRHGLKSVTRVTHTKKKFTFIDVEVFWEWCYRNLQKVDISKIEPYKLLPQPEWFERERKQKRTGSNYKTWTVQEQQLLQELVRSGKDYSQIAVLLNRTTNSIMKKHKRLIQFK